MELDPSKTLLSIDGVGLSTTSAVLPHVTFWRFLGTPFEQVQFLPLVTFYLFLGPTHISSGF